MATMDSHASLKAFFLPVRQGQRLCIHHSPASATAPVRAAMVYVHPLGDEMNKSRHLAAMTARALAATGCAVLQIDLFGCGDSSGRFEDATWEAWNDDIDAAIGWLVHRHPGAPLWLWGLRAGCLLASEAAVRWPGLQGMMLWHPVATGHAVLHQWLRLASAGVMLGNRHAGRTAAQMRSALAAGQTVEVGGYALAARLASAIEAAELLTPAPGTQVHWLEVASRSAAPVLAASRPVIEAWQGNGLTVRAQTVEGPSFWQTTELEIAPALVNASLAAVCDPAGIPA